MSKQSQAQRKKSLGRPFERRSQWKDFFTEAALSSEKPRETDTLTLTASLE